MEFQYTAIISTRVRCRGSRGHCHGRGGLTVPASPLSLLIPMNAILFILS